MTRGRNVSYALWDGVNQSLPYISLAMSLDLRSNQPWSVLYNALHSL